MTLAHEPPSCDIPTRWQTPPARTLTPVRRFAIILPLVLCGCSTVAPTPTPSAGPLSADELPQLACPGQLTSTVIDYASDAPGAQDIEAATRALDGVDATDVVLRHGDSTAVVRAGRPIWTGDWVKGERGYLLTYVTACSNIGVERR